MTGHGNAGNQEDPATELKNLVMTEVNAAFVGNVLTDFNTREASHEKPHTFTDIMGPETAGYWWRLYIDPKDWEDAQKEATQNHWTTPGLYYDHDKSQGWKSAMTETYRKYLVNPSLEEFLGDTHKPFTWAKYLGVWTDAKHGLVTQNPDGFYDRVDTKDRATQFGCPRTLAQDTVNESIFGKRLVRQLLQGEEANFLKGYVSHPPNEDHYIVVGGGITLKKGVEAVFTAFTADMNAATLRKNQLKAIARVVRDLHIMHTFSDGCGRVNIQTLLPAMLLKYGFGLPLGGARGAKVDKGGQFLMFNGGYTLDEITRWLWITQDFGLTVPDNQTSLKRQSPSQPSHPGSTGGHPPPGGNGSPPSGGHGHPSSGGNAHPPPGGNAHPPSGGNAHPPPGGNAHPPPGGNAQPPAGGKTKPPSSDGKAQPPPGGKPQQPPSNKPQPPPGGKSQPPPAGKPQPPPTGKPQRPPAGKPQPPPSDKPQPLPVGKPQPPPSGKPQPPGKPGLSGNTPVNTGLNNNKPTPRPTNLTHVHSAGPLH